MKKLILAQLMMGGDVNEAGNIPEPQAPDNSEAERTEPTISEEEKASEEERGAESPVEEPADKELGGEG